MSGADILAALAIIAAAADTATKVFDAIHAGKDLFDSFSNKKDYSDDLRNYTDQIKQVIQDNELQSYVNKINGAGLWYYRCQTTIQACQFSPVFIW